MITQTISAKHAGAEEVRPASEVFDSLLAPWRFGVG